MVPVHQGNTIYHPGFFFFSFFSGRVLIPQIKSTHPTIHREDSPQVWVMLSPFFVTLLGEGRTYIVQFEISRMKNSTVKIDR